MELIIDIKKDFWKLNPMVIESPIFMEFKDKYKDSSIMMWNIYMGIHPDGIIYKSYDLDKDRYEAINKNLFKYKSELIDFNDPYFKNLIRIFEKTFIPIHRLALIKMDKFVKEYLYEIEDKPMNAEKVKLLKGYKEIIPLLDLAIKQFNDGENAKSQLKDGGSLTAAQDPMSMFGDEDFE